jgi:hypothetical protein
MPKRHNQTGRSVTHGQYVRLFNWMLNSDAWLSLTPAARTVYIELHAAYNGTNNGRLGLSVRRAAKRCRIAKDTAAHAFEELAERGFIECMKKGAFSLKLRHATEWRLTHLKCDVSGRTGDASPFMKWSPKNQNTVPIAADSVVDLGPMTDERLKNAA